MKLPPMALTAPSLCPRCDSPAMFEDHCVYCQLQLRQCGACQGVGGPFDRYCGFCGHEMVWGRKRSPVWRLWLVAALVPLGGTFAFGVLTAPALGSGTKLVRPTPVAQVRQLQSQSLKFVYAIPPDWNAFDYTEASGGTAPQPFVVTSRLRADTDRASAAKGNLLSVVPQGAVAVLGRPQVSSPGVDPGDPVAVLAFQVGQLVAKPPAGSTFTVIMPAHALLIDGKPAAEAVLKLSKSGSVFYFERAYIAARGSTPLFSVDATAPQGDWEGGDGARLEAVIQSLKLNS